MKPKRSEVLGELEAVIKREGWELLTYKREEGWMLTVQNEHGTVAHSLGMSKEQAAANILDIFATTGLAAPLDKVVPAKKTKPVKAHRTKETKQ